MQSETNNEEIARHVPGHPAYPPGGIMIWLVVSIELLTFIPALIVFMAERRAQLEVFQASAARLDAFSGTLNTIALLSGGWLMAAAITALRERKESHALRFLGGAIGCGVLFLIIKGFEYATKLDAGLDLRYNEFFTFYWLLTGFHYVHVALGVCLLAFVWLRLRNGVYSAGNFFDVETCGVFWHMCDLIWILIFPVFYLIG